MTLRHLLTAAAITAAAAAATGCADPYATRAPKQAPAPGELPAPPVPAPDERLGRLPTSPEAAVRRAAKLTTTWTAYTAADRYVQLATFSTGAARRNAREAAARLPTDPHLDGTSSHGRVAAIIRRSASRRRRELLVVTHETVRADGLVERRWRVTLATIERRSSGWAISRWEPQP